MKTSFVVISAVIVLLALDLRFKVYLTYNILKNIGHIKVKLFNITIFSRDITITVDHLNLTKRNKKVVKIKLDFTDKGIKLFKETMAYYKEKIYFISFDDDIYLSTSNPFATTLIVGILRSIGGGVVSYVTANNPHVKLNHDVYAGFVQNNVYVDINTHFMLNLFDLLWSILKVIYRRSIALYERR